MADLKGLEQFVAAVLGRSACHRRSAPSRPPRTPPCGRSPSRRRRSRRRPPRPRSGIEIVPGRLTKSSSSNRRGSAIGAQPSGKVAPAVAKPASGQSPSVPRFPRSISDSTSSGGLPARTRRWLRAITRSRISLRSSGSISVLRVSLASSCSTSTSARRAGDGVRCVPRAARGSRRRAPGARRPSRARAARRSRPSTAVTCRTQTTSCRL